jgi:N-acylneuraminate cytidylyltransferase
MLNVALIPARSGSKRLPSKNIKLLNGLPLIYYTITSAINSNKFSEIIVSTDSKEIASLSRQFGATASILRPTDISADTSTDIEWVEHALKYMVQTPVSLIDFVAILRPTSPLRKSSTISKALDTLSVNPWADSLRAMDRTFKHPGKMWLVDERRSARPYLEQAEGRTPTHDSPTQSLQEVWIQNASLEIVRVATLIEKKSISGKSILAFEMPEFEGYDINNKEDFEYLEYLIDKRPELLIDNN